MAGAPHQPPPPRSPAGAGGGPPPPGAPLFGSGAAAALMAAAHQQRLQRRSAADEERADALGSVHLVGADGAEMAAEAAHVQRNLASALHGVNVKEGASRLGDLANLFDRLQHAGLVVGQHHADQSRLWAKRALNRSRI